LALETPDWAIISRCYVIFLAFFGDVYVDHIISFIFFLGNVEQGELGTGGAASGAGNPAGPAGEAQGGGMMSLLFLGGLLLFMYFILIRPQQKRAKKHKELVSTLKRGDSVITTTGIYGKVDAIDGEVITLDIGVGQSKGTKVKVLRHFVGGRANEETEKELSQAPA
jgi:preprotein translocase subunit YajC